VCVWCVVCVWLSVCRSVGLSVWWGVKQVCLSVGLSTALESSSSSSLLSVSECQALCVLSCLALSAVAVHVACLSGVCLAVCLAVMAGCLVFGYPVFRALFLFLSCPVVVLSRLAQHVLSNRFVMIISALGATKKEQKNMYMYMQHPIPILYFPSLPSLPSLSSFLSFCVLDRSLLGISPPH
jgi:hypothetical protein